MSSTLLTTGEVAAAFRVRTSTVARWADSGKLPSFRTPGGRRRFHSEDVDRLLAERDAA
jgi:excisionase family DNA binding protein